MYQSADYRQIGY